VRFECGEKVANSGTDVLGVPDNLQGKELNEYIIRYFLEEKTPFDALSTFDFLGVV